jgi:two-component system sensor histidine kinase KdpD
MASKALMASKGFARPDPDELLRQLQAQEADDAQGRLKIFLGYAPRVGKSMRMFDEGRRRRKRGQDVVIGAIQAKGVDDLKAAIGEFEIAGQAGTLDVEAILKRNPHVCLIDELARDNAPGSRHQHRWQDVDEIRSHGINVIGAVNLQHVFEQQEAVQRITGRRADTSVPVSFIDSADELVIVDVPAEELARHGGGAGNLTPEQLSELRELALLLAAQVVEEQLRRYMDAHGIVQSWGTQERILVCITPRSNARAMLESGARATTRFHGQMLAVYVRQPELSREGEETIAENMDYARKLGAEVFVLEGDNPISEILRFAHEQRITQVFIGHTQQPAWKFWAPSPVERLIRESEDMDVRLFPHP